MSSIANGSAALLVKDESLLKHEDADFIKFLRKEGFEYWQNGKGFFDGVDWVYVNLNSKLIAPGMPGISVTTHVGNHAVTIDEFKQIYGIFKKYEGLKPLEFSESVV